MKPIKLPLLLHKRRALSVPPNSTDETVRSSSCVTATAGNNPNSRTGLTKMLQSSGHGNDTAVKQSNNVGESQSLDGKKPDAEEHTPYGQ